MIIARPVTLAVSGEKMTLISLIGGISIAVAVEGQFRSLFQYCHKSGIVNLPFRVESEYNRMFFVADYIELCELVVW